MNIYSLLTSLFFLYFALYPITVKAQIKTNNQIKEEKISSNQSVYSSKLRVGIAGEPPGVMVPYEEDQTPTGISVEIWKELAEELNLNYKFIYHNSVSEALNALTAKEIDLAIGSISITDKRIARFDFTQPISQANLTVLVPTQSRNLWTVIKPFLRLAFLSSISFIFLCLFIVGNLLWLVERKHNSEQFPKTYFKGVSQGMWCALATFTTVGYGDRYPITPLGRFVAGMWMLISVAAVSTLTAGIVTTLGAAFSPQPYKQLTKPADLKGLRLAATSDSAAVEWGEYYQARVIQVDHLSDAVSLLKTNKVDGLVYTRLTLEHYLQENPQADYELVDFNIGTQNYGIALNRDHPLTRELDKILLSVEMQTKFQRMVDNWFQFDSKTKN